MRPFDIFVPKFHVIFHALAETGTKGNPFYYACWLDESLNKQLKACCRNASQATFDHTILHKTKEVLKCEPHCIGSRKRALDEREAAKNNCFVFVRAFSFLFVLRPGGLLGWA